MERAIDFVNAGTEPVYSLQIGHRADGQWDGDLLGDTQVLDVGDSVRLRVDLEQTCWYDVRAGYGDGHVQELDGVDLCSRRRLFLRH